MTVPTRSLLTCLAVVTVASVICGQTTSAPATGPAATSQPTTAPNAVVAEIRGQKLTWSQFQAVKKYLMPPSYSDQQIIDFWKLNTILADEFQKSGLADDPEIKQAIAVVEKRLLGEVYRYLMQKRATVSDEQARQYYKTASDHPEFREPPVVTFKVIATKTKDQLEPIMQRLKNEVDFDTLMKENAERTCAITGLSSATVKNVSTQVLRPTLGVQANALATVKTGTVRGPVKIPHGYAIFKVVDRQEGKLKPFEQVRDKIEARLLRMQRSEVDRELMRAAKEEAGIEPRPRRPGQHPPTTRPSAKPKKPKPKPTTKPSGK